MVESDPLVIGGVIVLLGAFIAYNGRSSYDRYRTLTDVVSDRGGSNAVGAETAIRGPVHVAEAATPERPPPGDELDSDDSPALWAWRIREKRKRGGSQGTGTTWRTADGGLAVGEFAVERDWERARVDAGSHPSVESALLDGSEDPFDAPGLFLGDPDVDVRLGEPGPITRRLEKWGVTGENGLLSGWGFTISFGRETLTPDRYQATAIRDGDELVARGELAESADGPVLRGTDETPLVIATGDLEARAEGLRSSARWYGAAGAAVALAGVALAATGFL